MPQGWVEGRRRTRGRRESLYPWGAHRASPFPQSLPREARRGALRRGPRLAPQLYCFSRTGVGTSLPGSATLLPHIRGTLRSSQAALSSSSHSEVSTVVRALPSSPLASERRRGPSKRPAWGPVPGGRAQTDAGLLVLARSPRGMGRRNQRDWRGLRRSGLSSETLRPPLKSELPPKEPGTPTLGRRSRQSDVKSFVNLEPLHEDSGL